MTDASTFRASLVDDRGVAVVGRSVQFFADGSATPFATASTNAFGTASVTYAFPPGTVGPHSIVAAYGGDSLYTSSLTSASFTVTKDATTLTYTGVTSSKPSKSLSLSAGAARTTAVES